MDLKFFSEMEFLPAVKRFFDNLGIPFNKFNDKPATAKSILAGSYKDNLASHQSIELVYFVGGVDDKAFNFQPDVYFQEENLIEIKSQHYDGLYIFGVILKDDSRLPTRTAMAEITRDLKREFIYAPVAIIFKYNGFLTFAAIVRTAYSDKKTWHEYIKLGKVYLLKDINIEHTHTGHLKILEDLKLKSGINNYEAMFMQWREVFDVQLLNKRFYQEVANWYFWAMDNVEFPMDAGDEKDVRNAISLIRLLTRLIFVWFLKEKHLVPEELFDKGFLDSILDYKDKTGSTFYKAILQNLFFATLNKPMKKDNPKSRIFIDEAMSKGFISDGYLHSSYFRYERFIKNPELLLEKYSSIPFINCGLFECLDYKIEDKEIWIDCFSDITKNEMLLKVPDDLFFGIDRNVDLNTIYDTKNKTYHTSGLINILNSYKFTVDENTPIEEEIALDPELLGKVFENLLAIYNPDTRTTARKQTGSFYTPREIVNYMVDESLIAYLENRLNCDLTDLNDEHDLNKEKNQGNHINHENHSSDNDVRLRQLFSYTDEPHQFHRNEVNILLDAIENLKLLDPACGSGAFLIGALHKLVFILQKLDPVNRIWKQKLIDRTPSEIRDETEKALDNKPLDYIRKLGIIESCIYGVDIQPIAIQICKLRFFISLIVEQNTSGQPRNSQSINYQSEMIDLPVGQSSLIVNNSKPVGQSSLIVNEPNLGIKPLPNLETKFVAANTLIGMDRGKKGDTIQVANLEIENAKQELFRIIKDIFFANSTKKKWQLAKREKDAREKLKVFLVDVGGLCHTITEQIANWDRFNQNASSGWFDPEFMFGISHGFDVVLGNPPYVSAVSMARTECEKSYYKQFFPEATGSYDLYVLFLIKTLELIIENGIYTWIIPNKFLVADYAVSTKNKLIGNGLLYSIDVSTFDVFENTRVYPLIIFGNRGIKKVFQEFLLEKYTDLELRKFKTTNKLREHKIFSDFNIKFASGATGFEAESLKQFLSEKNTKNSIPFIVSGCVDRYCFSNSNVRFMGMKLSKAYISRTNDIASSKWAFWMKSKIVIAGMTKVIESVFVQEPLALGVGVYAIYDWGVFNPIYLSSVLNSKYLTYYINIKFKNKHLAGGYLAINKSTLEKLPLVKPTKKIESIVVNIANKIISSKEQNQKNDTSIFEKQIDLIIYKIYQLTYNEVKIIESESEFEMTREEYEMFEAGV